MLLSAGLMAAGLLGDGRGASPAEWTPGRSLFDDAFTEYKRREAGGAMTSLARRLAQGETQLAHEARMGYLPALLRELDIPVSSQVLVYSKTSARKHEVSPKTPRALYFNDNVSVAYFSQTTDLEIAALDPNLGVAFYRLAQAKAERPRLMRDDRCLECHLSSRTFGIPGWMVRSFLTREDGDIDPLGGKPMVTHRTPFEERWGGYYVTGRHGDMTHLGNLLGAEAVARHAEEPRANGNIVDLSARLDLRPYPETGSDIVALLVLDHQACMLNLLIRLRFEAEAAVREGKGAGAIDGTTEAVLRYMLFVEEVPLKSPVQGTSAFAAQFSERGPRDAQGRSLRQLDLQTRLLKFPCSFLIYSEAFDQLPEIARRHLYRRLWDVLNGDDPSPIYQRIPMPTRQAIREILIATKRDLPVYWRL